MSRSELAKEVRRVHRERYGEVSPRHSREEASEMLDDAEAELEFLIPKLVRTVFALSGSDFVDLDFAVDRYGNRTQDGGVPVGQAKWPDRMLPIKPLDDRLWLCIDCNSEGEPVYLFDDDHEIQSPDWRNRFTKVAATFTEFLQEFIDSGGEWPTRPEYDAELWIEYQGKRFRLTSACLGADDHVSEHLDHDEYPRIEQTVTEAKVASKFPSQEEMEAALEGLRFHDCNLDRHEMPRQDATQLVLFCIQIPGGDKARIIVFQRRNDWYTLIDDFVAQDRPWINRVHELNGELVYSGQNGAHVQRRPIHNRFDVN